MKETMNHIAECGALPMLDKIRCEKQKQDYISLSQLGNVQLSIESKNQRRVYTIHNKTRI